MQQRGFVILDFGSQFTQLIGRGLRELGYYSEILPFSTSVQNIETKNPYGVILSGGPNSVYAEGAPQFDVKLLTEKFKVLGVCYGMQLLVHGLGGKVTKARNREYGLNTVSWSESLGNIPVEQKVWMSHGDVVEEIPEGLRIVGMSDHHPAALLGKNILAVQFHPEVAHTEQGEELLLYFAKMCSAKNDWKSPQIIEQMTESIKAQVGNEKVLMGLSGGVDSTVVATLVTKVLGASQVQCVFVNNGLLRKNEYHQVLEDYKKMGLQVNGVDAEQIFLSALEGVSDPEQKRKIIGAKFIEVFENTLKQSEFKDIRFLAQGTLYPDVIESVSSVGGSVTIKSHHNVGGLPERMKFQLLEPVRHLFKDEVRSIGRALGVPEHLVDRHPFPGPGLSIRILGNVTREKLDILKEADAVYIKALRDLGLYHKIWQAFCVLLPIQTVGVQGDSRSYEQVLALRAVTSKDGMTADWYPFEFSDLREISNRITNQVRGINRVVYDVTSKPPATIEWE